MRRYLLPRLLIPKSFGLPPVVDWRGTRPSQAARSRAWSNVSPLPIAAISAEVISTPTPGIDNSSDASSFVFANVANSASNSPMRRSSSVHCARMSSTSLIRRALRPTHSPSSNSATSFCSSLRRPCATMIPRSNKMARSWLISAVRSATRRSRARCSVCRSSCSWHFSSTRRMVGRVAASAMASASRSSSESWRLPVASACVKDDSEIPSRCTPGVVRARRCSDTQGPRGCRWRRRWTCFV